MGSRGPRPTPTAILKRRGSPIAKAREKVEPKPERCRPPAPTHLSKPAKKLWRKATELLDGMGVMTTADVVLLERYVETLVFWRQCRDQVTEKGFTQDNSTGTGLAPIPEVQLLGKFHTVLLQIERELGLTPSARTRLAVGKKDGEPGRPGGTADDRATGSTFMGPRLRAVGPGA